MTRDDTMRRSSNARLWTPFLLLALLVASCALDPLHEQLPGNWPRPAPPAIGDCPDISGQYRNSGETIENKNALSLFLQLFAKEFEAWMNVPFADYPFARQKEITHIAIQQPGQNRLDIAARKGDEILYSKSLSKEIGDFSCEDGWLIIKTTSRGGGSGVLTRTHSTFKFANSDEYLLEVLEQERLVVFLIVPTTRSTVKWYRFSRS